MIYKIEFTFTALSSLKKLDKPIANKILRKLEWLGDNLDFIKPIPLKGQFSGLFKLRIGNYRIIYDIDCENFVITVHYIGHRKDIYQLC